MGVSTGDPWSRPILTSWYPQQICWKAFKRKCWSRNEFSSPHGIKVETCKKIATSAPPTAINLDIVLSIDGID